ncbi:acyl-CoA thioesterase [Sphingomonas montanisoli]|nr:acyl-CoA thioesterase domain-containing protein [Sphingomonas montanisoli]
MLGETQSSGERGDAPSGLRTALSLELAGKDRFIGRNSQTRPRVYGGQLMAQALLAASNTVEGPQVAHSLHAYFGLRGDVASLIDFEVDRVKDGASYSIRRARAFQNGREIFSLSASFQRPEEGLEHQALEAVAAPAPEDLPTTRAGAPTDTSDPAYLITTALRPTGFEPRWIDPYPGGPPRPGVQRLWVRSQEPLGDDPMLHRAALAYISDYPALEVALLPFGFGWSNGNLSVVSLDHAMWFHRDFDLNDWLLCSTELVSAQGGRAFVRGSFYDRAGALVATFTQEGVVRLTRKAGDAFP